MPRAVMRIHGRGNLRACSLLRAPYRVTPESLDAWAPPAMPEPQVHRERSFFVSSLASASCDTAAKTNVATVKAKIRIVPTPNLLKRKQVWQQFRNQRASSVLKGIWGKPRSGGSSASREGVGFETSLVADEPQSRASPLLQACGQT